MPFLCQWDLATWARFDGVPQPMHWGKVQFLNLEVAFPLYFLKRKMLEFFTLKMFICLKGRCDSYQISCLLMGDLY